MNGKTFGKLARDSRNLSPCIYEGTNGKEEKCEVCDERRRKTHSRRVNDLAVKRKTIRATNPRQRTAALTIARKVVRHGC